MKNKIRWLVRKAIRQWASGRPIAHLPCPIGQPRSIAYFIVGGIGDAIMAYPALRMLRKAFPGARLEVFVPKKSYAILAAMFHDITIRAASSVSLKTALLNRGFDIALGNTVTVFYLAAEWNAFFSARYAYGFRYPDEPERGRLYNATLVIEDGVHDIEQNRRLVATATGIPFAIGTLPYGKRSDTVSSDGAVVIHPGAERGYEYKRWPQSRFRELVVRLAETHKNIAVILGPSEMHLAEVFSPISGVQCVVNTSASKLVELIRDARLFIGNDSGPAHIAAFFNTPALTLVGPVDPRRTEPRGQHSITIYNKLDCAPCHFGAVQCPESRCMESITVEQVLESARKIMASV